MLLSQAVKNAGWVTEPAPAMSHVRNLVLSDHVETAAGGAIVGVDIGGTKIHLACWGRDGIAESRLSTDSRGGKRVLDDVESAVRDLTGTASLQAVAVGVPGTIDKKTGRLGIAPNLQEWDCFDVPAELSRRLNVPVRVENDVHLAAYGEYVWTGSENLTFIALGTGIGMGTVANGEIITGASGGAGEIFDVPALDSDGTLVELEDIVCGPALERHYFQLAGKSATTREIINNLENDSAAAQAFGQLTMPLAQLIATAHSLLESQPIVLGGGLGIRPEVFSAVTQHLRSFRARPVALVPSALGARAGTAGALALAATLT